MPFQWNIFRASLDPVHGHEQAGERPVLVVSAEPINEHYPVVTVVPITSRKRQRVARLGEVLLPARMGGLPVDSFALCFQIRALDKERLGDPYGEIPDGNYRRQITSMLGACLDIPLPEVDQESEVLEDS
jgi:mRNA interferase MazF